MSHTSHQLCRNCGRRVDANYCPDCGQRTTTGRLSWGALVDSLTSPIIGDEAYGLRGINMRKGAVMTWLTILVNPCIAISEYLEGRRHKYYNPVAILLLLSTAYAIIFSLIGKEYIPINRGDQNPLLELLYTFLDYAALHPAATILLKVPFLALALKTVFRRRSDLRYVEYIYIGIFIALFEITLKLIALPTEVLFSWYDPLYMQHLPVFIYTTYVFWKFFGLKKKGAVLRTLLINLLQYIYLFVVVILLFMLGTLGYALIAPDKL